MMKLLYTTAALMIIAGSAQAYGTEPDTTAVLSATTEILVADACTPQLSPRMAAAFGLPIAPMGCPQG